MVAKKIPRLGSDESLLVIIKALISDDTEPSIIRACLDFIEQVAQPREGGASTRAVQKNIKKDLFELCFNRNPSVAAKAFRLMKAHISEFELKASEIQQVTNNFVLEFLFISIVISLSVL